MKQATCPHSTVVHRIAFNNWYNVDSVYGQSGLLFSESVVFQESRFKYNRSDIYSVLFKVIFPPNFLLFAIKGRKP